METLTEREAYLWCREMDVTAKPKFAVSGELRGASDEDILKIVNRLIELAHPKVVDRRKEKGGQLPTVLISTRQILSKEYFPSMIAVSPDYGRQWRITWPTESEVETRQQKSTTQLRKTSEGQPSNPFRASQEETAAPADVLMTAMEKLVSQFAKMQPEGNYHHLRTFSGALPTPGEEGYETWRDITLLCLEECQCTDAVKKQRIVESLRGAAMEVVQAAWRSKPQATYQDYMSALEDAFGSPEDATDLLYKLRTTYQLPDEKMSDYLYQLDKLVHRIVSKGGVSPKEVDQCHLEQVLRGALTHDPIAQRMRSCDREKIPGSFHELLKEVHKEGVILAAREKTSPRVTTVALKPAADCREMELLTVIEKQGEQIPQLLSAQAKTLQQLQNAAEVAEKKTLVSGSENDDLCRVRSRKPEG
ncbi:paraneoplastic antigen Ma1 homolog [Dendrobates tinctorius]|uniref:paraneoplastic antigen Ma1 homolog n=1 Tax=Dendrobates tinctorius TaxID=92724 RepID=UPI003CC9FEA6